MKYPDFIAPIIIAQMRPIATAITLFDITIWWAMVIGSTRLFTKDRVCSPEILPISNIPKFPLFLNMLVVMTIEIDVVLKAICVPTHDGFEDFIPNFKPVVAGHLEDLVLGLSLAIGPLIGETLALKPLERFKRALTVCNLPVVVSEVKLA